MKILWNQFVSKFVQKLKELDVNEGSRIWWCPTSVLSAFLFHAVGPYQGADDSMKYILDDYIPSYTLTLARSSVQNGTEKMPFAADTKLPSAKKKETGSSEAKSSAHQ
ncbi:TPR-like protein [Sanghuangporus baumii]|uniref:TPR-like protein n=1 Tax=Sanghuangporus baumii TaxID=108892 RepID=A0A9Q5N0T5_SANBA|nr:TPR-like protein [Sanghuangporus baumii]